MVVDVLQFPQNLTLIQCLALACRVVVDRDNDRAATCCDLLPVDRFNAHQQREWAAFLFAAEVVVAAELPLVPSDKQMVGYVFNTPSRDWFKIDY